MHSVKYICVCYDFAALVFASGLATTTAITYLLKSGDHILSMNDLYGGWTTYSQSNRIVINFVKIMALMKEIIFKY